MLKNFPWRALVFWVSVAVGGAWLAALGPLRPVREKLAPTEPRLVSAIWRPPTGWEAWKGYDSGLTVTLVSNPAVVPYPMVALQTVAGEWEAQTGGTQSNVYPGGRWRTYYEERLGFRAQRFDRLDHKVAARISWTDSRGKNTAQTARVLELEKQADSWPGPQLLRTPTFQVLAGRLETSRLEMPRPSLPLARIPPGSRGGLQHRISLDIKVAQGQAGHSAAVDVPQSWALQVQGGPTLELQLGGYTALNAAGQSRVWWVLEERMQTFPQSAATVNGVLSAGGSWPLRVRLSLPAGLPRSPGTAPVQVQTSPVIASAN